MWRVQYHFQVHHHLSPVRAASSSQVLNCTKSYPLHPSTLHSAFLHTPARVQSKQHASLNRRHLARQGPRHNQFRTMSSWNIWTKKDRKKLQNKNAAIRYRMKKKEEAQDI